MPRQKEQLINSLDEKIGKFYDLNPDSNQSVIARGGFNKVSKSTGIGKTRAQRSALEEGSQLSPNLLQILIEKGEIEVEDLKRHHILTNFYENDQIEIQKLYEGNLGNLIGSGLSDEDKHEISAQLITAVNFLHSHNIVHNDIKPENVFYYRKNGKIEIVLGDLDELRRVDENGCFLKNQTHEYLINDNPDNVLTDKNPGNTRKYASYQKEDNYTKYDICSLKLTLLELYTERMPESKIDARIPIDYDWMMSGQQKWVDCQKGKLSDDLLGIINDLESIEALDELDDIWFSEHELEEKDYYFLNNEDPNSYLKIYMGKTRNFILGAEYILNYIRQDDADINSDEFKDEFKEFVDAAEIVINKENISDALKTICYQIVDELCCLQLDVLINDLCESLNLEREDVNIALNINDDNNTFSYEQIFKFFSRKLLEEDGLIGIEDKINDLIPEQFRSEFRKQLHEVYITDAVSIFNTTLDKKKSLTPIDEKPTTYKEFLSLTNSETIANLKYDDLLEPVQRSMEQEYQKKLLSTSLEDIQAEQERNYKDQIAKQFVDAVMHNITHTQWNTSGLFGLGGRKVNIDGGTRKVPTNVSKIYKECYKAKITGDYKEAFNQIAKIGRKASGYKPFFGKRDEKTQDFYNLFDEAFRKNNTPSP